MSGRVMDFPYAEVDKVAKLVPTQLNITLKDALKQEPRLQELVDQEARHERPHGHGHGPGRLSLAMRLPMPRGWSSRKNPSWTMFRYIKPATTK